MRCLTETRSGNCCLVNEDRFLCEPELSLFAVLDGEVHEGRAAIVALEVLRDASQAIADTLRRKPEVAAEAISSVVRLANQTIFQDANPRWQGAGTTLTCLALAKESIVVAHVGDSRAYGRDRSGWRCLTLDHSLVQEARRVNHPDLADFIASHSSTITRVLGLTPDVEVDTYNFSRSGISDILLCTDGFWRPLDPDLVYAPLPDITGPELLEFAYNAFEKDDQRDNASYVLVSF